MQRGKHLIVIIAPDGACTVDAINFTGPTCLWATREIADALGSSTLRAIVKPEIRIRERTSQPDREATR